MTTFKLITDVERLNNSIDRISTPDGCWPWTGNIKPDGYAQISTGSRSQGTFKMTSPHNFALRLRLGRPLYPGMGALHICDNKICCRTEPEGWYELNGVMRRCYGHLFEGTTQDNTADRHMKKRDAVGSRNGSITHPEALSRGSNRYNTHLTEDDVRTIRRRYAQGDPPQILKKAFNVSHSPFWRIINREGWQHVTDDE